MYTPSLFIQRPLLSPLDYSLYLDSTWVLTKKYFHRFVSPCFANSFLTASPCSSILELYYFWEISTHINSFCWSYFSLREFHVVIHWLALHSMMYKFWINTLLNPFYQIFIYPLHISIPTTPYHLWINSNVRWLFDNHISPNMVFNLP